MKKLFWILVVGAVASAAMAATLARAKDAPIARVPEA